MVLTVKRFDGVSAFLCVVGVLMGNLATAGSVAAAVSCPSGSVTWNVEKDANGNQMIQNAGDYAAGADTCFSYGANGAMTITQAEASYSSSPSSYPNDGYGCDNSYCSTGWSSKLWASDNPQITASLSTSGVTAGSKYDQLVDSFFTTTTGPFTYPNAEIEIVSKGAPSYSSLGFCASTTCGGKEYTIAGVHWWLIEKTARSGSYSWPDYIFVRNTQSSSTINQSLATFYNDANSSGKGSGLGSLNLGFIGYGSELWQNGLGLKITSVSLSNLP